MEIIGNDYLTDLESRLEVLKDRYMRLTNSGASTYELNDVLEDIEIVYCKLNNL